MRIAVEARELCGRPTGVGRYLSALLEEWSSSPDGQRHEWTLYSHEQPSVPRAFTGQVRIVPGNGGTKWQQWDLARALRHDAPDVIFAPGYSAPLMASAPVALTVHDVSYFDHPEWFAPREGWRLRTLTGQSVRRAEIVLTDSEFSRQRILHHLAVSNASVRRIYLGVRCPDNVPPREPREPVVLYVGSIFERRHVDWLLASFEDVADRVRGARLEIVGENRTRQPRLDLEALCDRSRHRGQITLRSYVDDATLADLYARASVFAFPSEYEGFGFTPLEALAAGVPPVVLDTPVAREICGDAARYITASEHHTELTNALSELLGNASARSRLLEHAPATLARFDWADTARATLAAIEEGAGAR